MQTIRMTSGATNIHSLIMRTWFKVDSSEDHAADDDFTYVAAIRDDYQWWHAHNESDTSGKLMLIDCLADKELEVVQVFFDDNIERDRAHIVDVRTLPSFSPIPFERSRGLYLQRVEPYDAILNDQYYIEIIVNILRERALIASLEASVCLSSR